MSALDNLAPDQRAVLQMVLQRGRSYDEIAALLTIDRGAVRQRALDAFDALTPASLLPGPERALVTDYLLGQLPERVSEQVYSFLEASEIDREWAQALAQVIAPLTPASLPEIPVGAPLGADPGPAGGLEYDSDPHEPVAAPSDRPADPPAPVEAIADAAAQWPQDAWSEPRRPPRKTPAREPQAKPAREPRPSSRRGGAILLGGIAVVVVAVILVVALTEGGAKKPTRNTASTGTGNTASQTVSTPSTQTGTTSITSTTTAVLAQLNLTAPSGAKSPVGIVQVVRVDGGVGMILVAQGVPANTTHNAYAVWLYNSPTSYKFVGFVQYLVGKSRKIDTEGRLKAGAGAYHHLLVTLETKSDPTAPGQIVLEGPFREHS